MPYTDAFKRLTKNITEHYLGRPVPTRFKKEFGKKYNQKEMLPLAIKIAKSRGVRIDKLDVTGGDKK